MFPLSRFAETVGGKGKVCWGMVIVQRFLCTNTAMIRRLFFFSCLRKGQEGGGWGAGPAACSLGGWLVGSR